MEYEVDKSDESTVDINLLQTTNNSRMMKKKLKLSLATSI